MELKATDHSYYCNDSNYFNNESFCIYDTWDDFKEGWFFGKDEIDHDYNHCFRFDINNLYDPDTDEELEGKFSLHLYMMLQRKGWFKPVMIREIRKSDMEEVEKYLKGCWDYLQAQWTEFSGFQQVKL